MPSRMGYDHQQLIRIKRRLGYTGPGLSEYPSIVESVRSFSISFPVVLERTEVDELLLKHLHVPFGLWLYRYVRVNVHDFLCSLIFYHACLTS